MLDKLTGVFESTFREKTAAAGGAPDKRSPDASDPVGTRLRRDSRDIDSPFTVSVGDKRCSSANCRPDHVSPREPRSPLRSNTRVPAPIIDMSWTTPRKAAGISAESNTGNIASDAVGQQEILRNITTPVHRACDAEIDCLIPTTADSLARFQAQYYRRALSPSTGQRRQYEGSLVGTATAPAAAAGDPQPFLAVPWRQNTVFPACLPDEHPGDRLALPVQQSPTTLSDAKNTTLDYLSNKSGHNEPTRRAASHRHKSPKSPDR